MAGLNTKPEKIPWKSLLIPLQGNQQWKGKLLKSHYENSIMAQHPKLSSNTAESGLTTE